MAEIFGFSTCFGPAAIVWTTAQGRPRILQVVLPGGQPAARWRDARAASCEAIRRLAADLAGRLAGERREFSPDGLDWSVCGEFQRRVLRAALTIPWGQTHAYGDLARRAGAPNAVRAVGRALATNPFPLLVPCHRVIRSDGAPGDYQGGGEMKCLLLEHEGRPGVFQGRARR